MVVQTNSSYFRGMGRFEFRRISLPDGCDNHRYVFVPWRVGLVCGHCGTPGDVYHENGLK